MRLSVPGNALLLGEYAVLEEGGLGAAVAVERRVMLDASPSNGGFDDLSVEGTWPGGSFRWTPSSPGSSALVSAVVAEVRKERGDEGVPRSLRIRIDSSALFARNGRKAGFGSSAAVCVALVAALLSAERADESIARLALSAHRNAQAGRGSGYDVYASFHGGKGLFRGGVLPTWEQREASWETGIFLFPGPGPVSTREAISRYMQWKAENPTDARDFLQRSNAAVMAFLSAASPEEASLAMRAGRDLGVELGEAIGVSARIPAPPGLDPDLCKSLGAGNELGAYFCFPDAAGPSPGPGLDRLVVSRKGITWRS